MKNNNNKNINDYFKNNIEYMIVDTCSSSEHRINDKIIDNYTIDKQLHVELQNRFKQIRKINKYNAIKSILIVLGLNWWNPTITELKQAITLFYKGKVNGYYDCLNKPFIVDGTIQTDREAQKEYYNNYIMEKMSK